MVNPWDQLYLLYLFTLNLSICFIFYTGIVIFLPCIILICSVFSNFLNPIFEFETTLRQVLRRRTPMQKV